MTKLDKVLKELGDLYEFNKQIQKFKIKKTDKEKESMLSQKNNATQKKSTI